MPELSEKAVARIRNRRALLWTCQQYDLVPGASTHAPDIPPDAVASLYRRSVTGEDCRLASLYWEAVWVEGAHSAFYDAYRSLRSADVEMRNVVTLSRPDDVETSVLATDFLVVAFPWGSLDNAPSPDAAYGALPSRVRQRTAWDLASRLTLYPDRLVVVVGAQTAQDVELLCVAFEDNPLRDVAVLLVDAGEEAASALQGVSVEVEVFDGTLGDFLEILETGTAPSAGRADGVPVRVGDATVHVDPAVVELVERRFVLLKENDLLPPETLSRDDLVGFLDGSLSSMQVFASGLLPVKRAYRTDKGETLAEELVAASARFAGPAGVRYYHVRLSAEGGSGATTLIRGAAFEAATAGVPTLILKPGQVNVDIDEIGAFLVSLTDAASELGQENPPVLLVFDAEHHANVQCRQVAQALAVQGKRPIILEVVPADDDSFAGEDRRDESVVLPCLKAALDEQEIDSCYLSFSQLASQYDLDFLAVPDRDDWVAYNRRAVYTTPDGATSARTTFWVTLRFFLVEGTDLRTWEEIHAPLSQWISRRTMMMQSPQSETLVNSVACLSYFRVACPLTTALRVSYGGRYSTDAFDTLRNLSDLIDWGDRAEDLADQTLYFRHPDVAREFLAGRGILWDSQVMDCLIPTLGALVDSDADRWLAETLAATSLVRGTRSRQDYDWRLRAFEAIPPVIRDTSRTVLHHWGRLLYQAAKATQDDPEQKASLFRHSITSLERALSLDSTTRRQERPGLVYNTLGTARWWLAEHLAATGAPKEAVEEQWVQAARCFELSIQSLPDNIEALLAYGYRLLARAGVIPQREELVLESAADRDEALGQALSLLDEADEALASYLSPDPSWQENLQEWRHAALTRLSSDEGDSIIQAARERGDVALAEYLKARRSLILLPGDDGEEQSLSHLLQVFDADSGVLDHRGLRLLIRLLRKKQPYSFEMLFAVHEALSRDKDYALSVVDKFRQAVLCYQTGRFELGAERFRRFRAEMREIQSSSPPQVSHDSLKSEQDPTMPAEVSLRVERVVNPLRAYGYVEELRQEVPVKPRQFPSNPGRGEVVKANVMFGLYGPYAVPPRRTVGRQAQ